MVDNIPSLGHPSDKEIKIQVLASTISTGTESASIASTGFRISQQTHLLRKAAQYVQDRGLAAFVKKLQERMGQGTPLGYSAAGIVEEVGPGVATVVPGDAVACAGGQFANHAEEIWASPLLTVKIPNGVSFEEASTVALGAIALQGIRRLEPQIGDTVAVIGLGLVGQLTAQLLKSNGVKVMGIDNNDQRVQFAKERGWIDSIEPMEGLEVDAVLITAHVPGNSKPLEMATQLARRRGKIVIVGDVGISCSRTIFYEKDLQLAIATSYGPGRYDRTYEEQGHDYPRPFVRWTAGRNMACYLDLIAQRKIQIEPLIQGLYPIEEAEKAYEALTTTHGPKPILTVFTYKDSQKSQDQYKPYVPKPKTTQTIRVGVIGAGNFVTSTHLPILKQLSSRFEIAAICTKHPEKAKFIAKQYQAQAVSAPDDIFNNPSIDLVLIGTRHDTHANLAMAAIKAKKAVFLEKPMALTQKELEALIAAYQQHPVAFHIGFNRRFSPLIQKIRQELQRLPTPWVVQYRVATETVAKDHWILGDEGGGKILGEACHMIDLIGYLFNQTTASPNNVYVQALSNGAQQSSLNDFSTTLYYPESKMATLLYVSSGNQSFGKERVEIMAGSYHFVLDDFKSLQIANKNGVILKEKFASSAKGLKEEWLAFYDFLLGKAAQPPISFEEAAHTTQLTLLVNQLAHNQH